VREQLVNWRINFMTPLKSTLDFQGKNLSKICRLILWWFV